MSKPLLTVGLFGGTFDPVHNGHLQMALEAKQALNLDRVYLIPSYQNPLKGQPCLTSEQRWQLLTLAVQDIEGLLLDDREIRQPRPSYTVDTLMAIREELGDTVSLTLIMGADVYSGLTAWHQWQRLSELAHLAVVARPGYQLPNEGLLSDWLSASMGNDIHLSSAGQVVSLELSPMDISATAIREQLAQGVLPDSLPPAVSAFIKQHQLYGFREI